MSRLMLSLARLAAALLAAGLAVGPFVAASGWFARRVLSRLDVLTYLAGSDVAQFSGRLLAEAGRKRARRELSPRWLRGWLTAVLYQAWRSPGRRGPGTPAFAIVAPAAGCNLRCLHCYAATGAISPHALGFDACDRLAAAADRAGTSLLIVSGGEPLLWRDGKRGVFDLAARHRGLLFVVYTNGTVLDAGAAEAIRRAGNVLPLLSVEGLERETDAIRGVGVWAAVHRAMGHLRAAGVLFGVSITATEANRDLLASGALLEQIVDRDGASFTWVLDLAPLGRATGTGTALDPSARDVVQDALEREIARGRLVVSFLHTARSSTGCFGLRRFDGFFYLDWEGRASRCVYQPDPSLDARPRLDDPAGADALLAAVGNLPACPLGAPSQEAA